MFFPAHKNELYIAPAAGKGRGLFCKQTISKGDVIESAPVIMFDAPDAAYIDKTNLYNYYFSLKSLSADDHKKIGIADPEKAGAIPLGLMTLCNHADTPNAVIEKTVNDNGLIFTLQATQDIPVKTEITISYGQIWFDII